jgi:hypothetical protein
MDQVLEQRFEPAAMVASGRMHDDGSAAIDGFDFSHAESITFEPPPNL